MGLTFDGGAVTEPVELTTAKQFLRVDHTAEDDLITLFISAARQYCENETSRILTTQAWTLTLDNFPSEIAAAAGVEQSYLYQSVYPRSGEIKLPLSPVQSVTSIKYFDENGVLQTLSTLNYKVDVSALITRITPAYDNYWPTTRSQTAAVEVKFEVGFGDTAGDVPPELRYCVLLMLGAMFENRQAVVQGMQLHELPKPQALLRLLSHYKIVAV